MLFGKMEAQKIICIHTVLFHGNVRCTNYANSVKNKLKHLSCEQIAAAIPAIRFAMILVLHIHFIRFSSLDRASHTVSGKERERERERIGGEKNKICKMKINGNEKSVRRVAKQTHTHARRGDYNNLQRNKRHSAPINTGGGAVPPPRRQIQLRLFMMAYAAARLPDAIRHCTARRHFLPFFLVLYLLWPLPSLFARLLISTKICRQ